MTVTPRIHSLVSQAAAEGRQVLTEIESKELLARAGVNVIPTRLAASAAEAVALSRELHFPVVLKIASPDITHKSDAGGVRPGLETPEQVTGAYAAILQAARNKYPQALIQGVAVQPMARPGTEVVIGMTRDAQFGPVIMFGLGGVFVEILEDISLRIAPLRRQDAAAMLREIKGYAVLNGYRGREPVATAKLVEMIMAVSAFAVANPEVAALDLNPVLAYSDDAVAVDARIVMKKSGD
jgi:acyl-CoA synthetase (NDP forming)